MIYSQIVIHELRRFYSTALSLTSDRKGQSKGRLRVLCIVVLEREQRYSAFMPVLTEGAAVEKGTFFIFNITKHHKTMYI